MNICYVTRTALCGCVVTYSHDNDEPLETRLFTAVPEDADIAWQIPPGQRRKGCEKHWHNDHHQHFRKLLQDDPAYAEGYMVYEPGAGMRHKLPSK